jgi:hypothetical protein
MPETEFANYWNYLLTGTEHGGPANVVRDNPNNKRDRNFWLHDKGYSELGDKAYTHWNKYDQDLLDNIAGSWHPGDQLPKAYFSAKKSLAPSLEKTTFPGFYTPPAKRLRGSLAPEYTGSTINTPSMFSQTSTGTTRTFNGGRASDRYVAFKARKLGQKGSIKSYRFKKQKKMGISDIIQSMYPIINWNMVANAVRYTSDVGKQKFYAGGVDNAMIKRDQMKEIYKKIFYDAMQSPQVNLVGGNLHYVKNGIASDRDDFKPSLQCLEYTRVYEISNRGDNLAYVEMWEVLALDDTDSNFVTQWQNNLTQSDNATDGIYGLEALHKNTTAPMAEKTYDITDPGLMPWKGMRNLNENWRIMKRTRYRLEPGSHTQHTVTVKGFSISHQALYDADKSTERWMKDLSINVVFKLIGERCYDNDSTANGTNHLSYMSTNCVFAYKDYTKWRVRPRLRKSFRFTTNSIENFNYETGDPAEPTFITSNDVPIANAPITAIPAYCAVNENRAEQLDRDAMITTGAETEVLP